MEYWKPIKDTQGKYEVSSCGRVRRTAHILKPYVSGGKRYFQIYLGTHRRWYIHRLVAVHFLDGAPKGFVVNHKDGNRLNNRLENLEFVTPKENVRHSIIVLKRHGGGLRKLTEKQIEEIRANTHLSLTQLAKQYAVSLSTILYHRGYRHSSIIRRPVSRLPDGRSHK